MMRSKNNRQLICALTSLGLALFLISAARASDDYNVTVSGFGTAGGAITSNPDFAYYHDSTEFVGATNNIDIGLESRLGVQAVVNLPSGFSVTAQEVVRERGSSEFSPGTEWLFAQYAANPDLLFRVGRVALATFLLSDSRNVGYTQTWMNVPNEVYGNEPFQTLDGVQARWRFDAGPVSVTLTGAYGSTSQSIQVNGNPLDVEAKTAYNVAATAEWKSVLLRISQTSGNSPFSLPLSQTLTIDTTTKDRFDAVGLQYDDGTAVFLSEWAERTQNLIPLLGIPLAGSKEWYAAGGWRFGAWTPMVSYGVWKGAHTLEDAEGTWGTWSASVRYDVARNIDLKLEVSRPEESNPRYFLTPNPLSSQRIDVLSFGADFVF